MFNVDLTALRAELQAELKATAQTGDTFGCDVIHGQIAEVESVMQLVQDRAEAAQAAPTFDEAAHPDLRAINALGMHRDMDGCPDCRISPDGHIVEITTPDVTLRHEFGSLRDARAYITSWRRANRGIAAEITLDGHAA